LDFDVFDVAWVTLIQRFHNTISYKNFPGPQNPDDRGLLVVDQTEERKLRGISRRMRRYNPVPSMFGPGARPIPITTLVEDAVHRNSLHSYFIQLADVNALFPVSKIPAVRLCEEKGREELFQSSSPGPVHGCQSVGRRRNCEAVKERACFQARWILLSGLARGQIQCRV
jgi:hypothetical protein